MSRETVIMGVNSNFHHIVGEDLFEKKDARFAEYRRRWKEWPENFCAGEFPLFIDVETTNLCNLKCPFCATTFMNKKVKRVNMCCIL